MAQPYYGHNQYGFPMKQADQQADRGSDTESDSESDSASGTGSDTASHTASDSASAAETGSESGSDSYAAHTDDANSESHDAQTDDTDSDSEEDETQPPVSTDPTQIMQQMQQHSMSMAQFHQPQSPNMPAPQNNYQRSVIMQQMQQPFMSKSAVNFFPPAQHGPPPMMQPIPMHPVQSAPIQMQMQQGPPRQPMSPPNQLQILGQMQQLSMSTGNLRQPPPNAQARPPQHRYQKSAHIMRQMQQHSKSMAQFNNFNQPNQVRNGNINMNHNQRQQNYPMQQQQQRQGLAVQAMPMGGSSQRSLYQQQSRQGQMQHLNGSSPNLRQMNNNKPMQSNHGYSASQNNMNHRSYAPPQPNCNNKPMQIADADHDHGSFLPPAPQSAQEQTKYDHWQAQRKARDEQKATRRKEQAAMESKRNSNKPQVVRGNFGTKFNAPMQQNNNQFRIVVQHK